MVEWKIEQTEFFEEHFEKIIPDNLKDQVKKLVTKIKENPYASKPLVINLLEKKR